MNTTTTIRGNGGPLEYINLTEGTVTIGGETLVMSAVECSIVRAYMGAHSQRYKSHYEAAPPTEDDHEPELSLEASTNLVFTAALALVEAGFHFQMPYTDIELNGPQG